jgi:hypothetical protein
MLSHDIKNKILKKLKFSPSNSSKSPKYQSIFSNNDTNNSHKNCKSIQSVNNPSNKSNDTNFTLQFETFTKELLTILKMRLSLESWMKPDEEDLKSMIGNNLRLIDLNHFDIKNINILVDDLIEIIKEGILLKQNSNDEMEPCFKIQNEKYIDFTKLIYRPQTIVPEDSKNLTNIFENCKLVY